MQGFVGRGDLVLTWFFLLVAGSLQLAICLFKVDVSSVKNLMAGMYTYCAR